MDNTTCFVGSTSSPTVHVYGEIGPVPSTSMEDYKAIIYFGDGTSKIIPLTSEWSMINKFHTYLSSEFYTIDIKLFHLGVEVENHSLEYVSYCSTILLNVYHDNVEDCSFNIENDHLVYKNIKMVVKQSGTPIDTFILNAAASYKIESP